MQAYTDKEKQRPEKHQRSASKIPSGDTRMMMMIYHLLCRYREEVSLVLISRWFMKMNKECPERRGEEGEGRCREEERVGECRTVLLMECINIDNKMDAPIYPSISLQ